MNTRNTRWGSCAIAVVALGSIAIPARGGYIMNITSSGLETIVVNPGDTFTVDIFLSSTTGTDQHIASVFQLVFSAPGLQYDNYLWGGNYSTGGFFDSSVPQNSDLPLLIDVDTYTDLADPTDIDILFDNFIAEGAAFTTGLLLSITLTMPTNFLDDYDFGLNGPIIVSIDPFSFSDGGPGFVPIVGNDFAIIPTPATLCLLAVAGLAGIRRRRRD